MSKEDLEKFKKIVLRSSDLQEMLKGAVNQEDFIELAVRIGQEKRCIFTAQELEESIEEQNQKQARMTFGEKAIEQLRLPNMYLWGRPY